MNKRERKEQCEWAAWARGEGRRGGGGLCWTDECWSADGLKGICWTGLHCSLSLFHFSVRKGQVRSRIYWFIFSCLLLYSVVISLCPFGIRYIWFVPVGACGYPDGIRVEVITGKQRLELQNKVWLQQQRNCQAPADNGSRSRATKTNEQLGV